MTTNSPNTHQVRFHTIQAGTRFYFEGAEWRKTGNNTAKLVGRTLMRPFGSFDFVTIEAPNHES